MKYCTNCGHELIDNPKFCPSCGIKIEITEEKDKPKMHKRESKSLKDKIIDQGKHKAKDFVEDQVKKVQQNTPSEALKQPAYDHSNTKAKNQKTKLGLWTMVYFIVNILLSFAQALDEKIGLLFFSAVILLLVILRRNKPKPYNVLAKIIIGVQIIFTIALIGAGFEDGYWIINIIYLTAMLFAELMLLFKGNQKVQ